jgi:CARDB/Bacterial pre-peptidase C-terminal domain/Bacterial Ig domain
VGQLGSKATGTSRKTAATAVLLALLVNLPAPASAATALPDLTVAAVKNPPAAKPAGDTFKVTDTVKNAGSKPAKASKTAYYLSVDNKLGAGDKLLSGSRSIPALKPKKTSKGSANVKIPLTTAAKKYLLLSCADAGKVVKEKSEKNNCKASAKKISVAAKVIIDTTPPNAPQLSSTQPASPSSDNSPNITGSAEANSTVNLYAGTTCSGSPVGSDSASSSGAFSAAVTVKSDSTTEFSATATDAASNVSACSAALTYIEDSSGPSSAPVITGSTPGSPSNDETPLITGTTSGGTQVRIYKTSDCSGNPAATGSAAQFSGAGILVTVTTNTTTQLRATQTDAVGNASPCSAPFSYVEDSAGPSLPTGITSVPASPANHNDPTIFGTAEANTTISLYTTPTCSGAPVASAPASKFNATGLTLHVADNSTTDIRVIATDAIGNATACTAALTYIEDSSGPSSAPVITGSTPGSPSNNGTPLISGTTGSAGQVKLYKTSDCVGSPVAVGSAADFTGAGIQVNVSENTTTQLRATQVDEAGNPSPCSAALSYVEDSTAPAKPSGITSAPASPANSNRPTIFGAAEAGSTVSMFITVGCTGDPVASASASDFEANGMTLAVLDDSTTDVRLIATDAVGNASACSASPDLTYVESSTPAETEVNDTPAQANALPGIQPRLRGTITGPSDIDYFSVQVPAGGSLTAETRDSAFSGCTVDTTLKLYAPNGTTELATDDNAGINNCSLIDGIYGAPPHPGASGLAAGTYYLAVDAAGSGSSSYQLRVTVAPAQAAQEVEPNGTTAQADARAVDPSPVALTGDSVIGGSISPLGDKDIFRMNLASASVIRIESFDASGVDCLPGPEPVVRILNSSGATIATDNASGIGDCGSLVMRLSSGVSYIQVEDLNNDELVAEYRLEISRFTLATNESEGNDTIATANPLPGSGIALSGDHEIATDVDYYAITVAQGKSVRAEIVEDNVETCESNGVNSKLTLLDADGAVLATDDDGGRGACSLLDGTGNAPKDSGAHNLQAGTYYLLVEATDANVSNISMKQFDYRLALTIR